MAKLRRVSITFWYDGNAEQFRDDCALSLLSQTSVERISDYRAVLDGELQVWLPLIRISGAEKVENALTDKELRILGEGYDPR